MTETQLMADIRLALGKIPGVTIFRNNCGKFKDLTGRWVDFGIGKPGGADLIGWKTYCGHAIFLAIECKTDTGKLTDAQSNFLRAVLQAGGRAGVARSVEDALAIVA